MAQSNANVKLAVKLMTVNIAIETTLRPTLSELIVRLNKGLLAVFTSISKVVELVIACQCGGSSRGLHLIWSLRSNIQLILWEYVSFPRVFALARVLTKGKFAYRCLNRSLPCSGLYCSLPCYFDLEI